jgi:hypothetical protein
MVVNTRSMSALVKLPRPHRHHPWRCVWSHNVELGRLAEVAPVSAFLRHPTRRLSGNNHPRMPDGF